VIRYIKPISVFFCLTLSINLFATKIISKKEDGSFLIMEKVDGENIHKWHNFVNQAEINQKKWARQLAFVEGVIPLEDLDDSIKPLLISIEKYKQRTEFIKDDDNALLTLKKKYVVINDLGDGISNFKSALANSSSNMSDVWVAYISLLSPEESISDNDKNDNIEIAMTVLAKKGSPLSMHMGIFRNPSYLMSKKIQHPRISPELHAFAAKASQANYPDLKYMITTPLASMANIFRDVLLEDSFAEGMNKKGAWVIRDEMGENNKPATPFDIGFKLALYDRDITDEQKQLVLLIDDDNKQDYWWLISRLHTSLEAHPYFVVKLSDLADSFKGKLFE
jgi:hypothetical protein